MTLMAGYRKKNADGPNSEDKALDLFAEMMIEKIESIPQGLEKALVHRGRVAMAEKSFRARV